jgi:predicted TIM-barrel enzyme
MATTFTREVILDRLNKTIAEGNAILGAGCSAGIIAKCAELGGADMILVYSTGVSRLKGLPTSRMGDNNGLTLEMAPEILWAAKNTPVIAGCEANDPFRMDQERLLDLFIDAGFHGVIPFPTVTMYDDYRALRDLVGMGFEREVELARRARERGILSVVYAHHAEDAAKMVEAGADVVIAHAGPTRGGLVGYDFDGTMEGSAAHVQKTIEASKAANPDVICLAHGGPFGTPKDTEYLYAHTDASGFVGASSIERIPVEKAVREVVEAFKSVPRKKG